MSSNSSSKRSKVRGKKAETSSKPTNLANQPLVPQDPRIKRVAPAKAFGKYLRPKTNIKAFKDALGLSEPFRPRTSEVEKLVIDVRLAFAPRPVESKYTKRIAKPQRREQIVKVSQPTPQVDRLVSMRNMVESLYQKLDKLTNDNDRADTIHHIGNLEAQLEEETLDPEQWAKLEKTIEHFARRAQDSFSPEWHQ